MMFIIFSGCVTLLYLSYKFLIYPAFFSPLAAIPNAHFTSSFSNGWIAWQRHRGQPNKAVHDAHTRLGPVVRLGLTEISVNSVEGLNTVYKGNFEKDKFYVPFTNYGELNMFSMVERQPHAKRRRMFGNIYSKSALLSSAVIQDLSQAIFIERLLPILASAASTGTPLNMLEYSAAIFSDFTTAFVFGLQSASNFVQDSNSRSGWIANKRIMTDITYWMMAFPPSLASFLNKLGINLMNPQINSAIEGINNMYLNMLEATEKLPDPSHMPQAEKHSEKWTEPVVYKQLLTQLQATNEKSPANPVPVSHLRLTIASELMDHLVAGTETSGWTLAYIMLELSQRPQLQSSLRKELLSLSPPIIYPSKTLDSDGSTTEDSLPSPRAVDALQLLEAIVLETLRLHAPVGGSQPRTTPSSTPQSPTTILGYHNIPPGTRVSAQAYSLHRNPDVFPDPEVWKPERWIEASPDERNEMLRWFWAFGSGANMCLGNHLAMLELKFVVAAIYTNFSTKVIDGEDMEQLDGYVGGPKGDKLILQFEQAG